MKDTEKEIVQLSLAEKNPTDRPGIVEELLTDLRESLPGIFTDLSGSGRTWLRGKSAQEAARAQQILSEVLDKIGRLKLDEREQEERHRQQAELHSIEMKQKQAQLFLSSLQGATQACRELTEMGVDVDMHAILAGLGIHINQIGESAPPTTEPPRIEVEKGK
jgi:hypothetical protein